MNSKILITGVGGPAAIAVIQSLQTEAVQFFVGDIDPHAAGLFLVPPAQRLMLLPGLHPSFVQHLQALCQIHKIDILIPTVDVELLAIAQHRDEFERLGVRVMLASEVTLLMSLDKFALLQTCAGIVPTPRTEIFNDAFNPQHWKFPLIVKPRSGSGGRGVNLVQNAADLRHLKRGNHLIAQEYLPGAEFSIDVFANSAGEILATVPRLRLKIDSGIAVTSRTVKHSQLENFGRLVAQQIKLTGVANIQFRFNANEEPMLLEVNPRFPGTMPLTIASGVHIPRLCLKDLLGVPIQPEELVWHELAMARVWQEIFFAPTEIAALTNESIKLNASANNSTLISTTKATSAIAG